MQEEKKDQPAEPTDGGAPAAPAAEDGGAPAPAPEAVPPAGEERLAAIEAEAASLRDRLLRAMAETENVRRRAERERDEVAKYAIANFAREMLKVADNLRRALDSVSAEARRADGALDNLMTGVEITEKEMLATFERVGIRPIDALGKRFDHNLHEALFEVPDPTRPNGTVAQVVERGYTLYDRLLRPAKVGVAKGGPVAGAAPAPSQPDTAASEPAATTGGTKAYDKPEPSAAGSQIDENL